MKTQEMREKRASLVTEARKLLESADTEKRTLNGEEEAQWERINGEIDRLGLEVEADEQSTRRTRVTHLEQDLRSRSDRLPVPRYDVRELGELNALAALPVEHRARVKLSTPEYEAAFWVQMRGGSSILTPEEMRVLRDPELRALQIGTPAEGGNLVPTDFERTLIEIMREANVMRQIATVRTFGNDRDIPIRDGNALAVWTAEEAAFSENDPTYAQISLTAFKAGVILKISDELLQDSAINMNVHLPTELGRAVATLSESAYVNGDGSGKPTGAVQGSTLGTTVASNSTIASDELIDLHDSLKRVYQNRATWLMAGSTRTVVRKLKESTGQYLWQPGLQVGHPDTLLGRPVVISDDVPAIATVAKSVLFGDFAFYWIADRATITLKRLEELYAANGQVGFRMDLRTDGKVTLGEAIKHLVHPV